MPRLSIRNSEPTFVFCACWITLLLRKGQHIIALQHIGSRMVRHGRAQQGTAGHRTAWPGAPSQGIALLARAKQGPAQRGPAWHGSAQHGLARLGSAHGTGVHGRAMHGTAMNGTAMRGMVAMHGTAINGMAMRGTATLRAALYRPAPPGHALHRIGLHHWTTMHCHSGNCHARHCNAPPQCAILHRMDHTAMHCAGLTCTTVRMTLT